MRRIFLAMLAVVPALAVVGCLNTTTRTTPASVTVITIGAAWLGAEANQKVSVPCSWVLNNPYGAYLPPDGKIPVTDASWANAISVCTGG